MIGIGLHIGNRVMGSSGGGGGFDADAQAFFDRVTVAGGTLTTTEQNATNQLVLDMKSAGIWSAMKAIYPMVGASAAACAQNLKSSSFTGTFTSGWTFSSLGVSTAKSTSSYMNTGILPSAVLSTNSHLSYYSNLNVPLTDSNVLMGANDLNGLWFGLYYTSNFYYGAIACAYTQTAIAGYPPKSFWLVNKSNSTTLQFRNNANLIVGHGVTTTPFTGTQNIYLNNYDGSSTFTPETRCAFASIGDGLTNTQSTDLYNAVQTFNTTLSRQN
jgi:hypothetical protein